MILKVLGVQVGTKNRSKIDQEMMSSWEGILASIFMDFGQFGRPSWLETPSKIGPKIDQNRFNNRPIFASGAPGAVYGYGALGHFRAAKMPQGTLLLYTGCRSASGTSRAVYGSTVLRGIFG